MTPEEVVRGALDAWSSLDVDEITGWFTDDAVWDNIPIGAVSGKADLRRAIEGWLARTASARIEIVNLAVSGNVVLTERVDHVHVSSMQRDAPAMGAFEIRGDKIAAWRDYFDMADNRGKSPSLPGSSS